MLALEPPPEWLFASPLLGWFTAHGRRLPWRDTKQPYHVLCAELMLQRTRASQVAPVFVQFMNSYATARDFVNSGPIAAERLFNRLGLKWRARTFWAMNLELLRRFDGRVPAEHEVLLTLPGVGEYAATAVRVFAFGQRDTVVDANVLRVMSRYVGASIAEHNRRSRKFRAWMRVCAPQDTGKSREFNWALIDLAEAVCLPREPLCSECPLSAGCTYGQLRLQLVRRT